MINIKSELEEIISYFKNDIASLRTGRATPLLVENIPVDYYGAKAPLKQVASISIPEPRQILVTPWNKDNLVDIEKALNESTLGLSFINTGEAIRITVPPLTEEKRKELVKLLGEKTENARIKIRILRDESRKEVQELAKTKKISDDEKFRNFEMLDKDVEEYNKKIENIRAEKEKEIMKI